MIIDSVLVDEIPNNCFVCKFSDRNIWGNKWICILTEEVISDAVDMGIKDHNCPISVYKKSIYYHDHLLAMDKLKARITELESKLRWIPVSEKKPLNEVDVFGYFNNGDYYKIDIVCYYAAEDVWTADDHVLRRGAVTYWFEMPELPDEVQDV